MICHIFGVGTNICENGNLLEISAIHINSCKMGARNSDINLARGKMNSEISNILCNLFLKNIYSKMSPTMF